MSRETLLTQCLRASAGGNSRRSARRASGRVPSERVEVAGAHRRQGAAGRVGLVVDLSSRHSSPAVRFGALGREFGSAVFDVLNEPIVGIVIVATWFAATGHAFFRGSRSMMVFLVAAMPRPCSVQPACQVAEGGIRAGGADGTGISTLRRPALGSRLKGRLLSTEDC